MHFDITPDGVVRAVLIRSRCDIGEVVSLRAIAAALGLTLVVGRSRGLHGTAVPGVIVYDGSDRSLAHELAHHACALYGLPVPHEERFVVAVASALVVPRDAYLRALRHGVSLEERALRFGVQETCVALREGETTGRPVAVWCGPGKLLTAGEWHTPGEIVERMMKARHKALRLRKLGDRPRRMLVTLSAG